MKAKKLEDGLICMMFAEAAWVCKKDEESRKESKREYSRGKYGWWVEKITPTVYGLYTQVYDGPDGDDWGSWIVRIHKGAVYVIDELHSDHGHYYDGFFKDRYNNVPTGLTQGDLE